MLLKLTGTSWGANADVIRISALLLVYSVAEYWFPVWLGSDHVHKVDRELNKSISTISGTLTPTPT